MHRTWPNGMPAKGHRLKTRKRGTIKPSVSRPIAPTVAHPFARYMEAHFEWLLVRGYSAETVKSRRSMLRHFIVWCAERGIEALQEITKPVLERYQRHLFYYRKQDGEPLTIGSQLNRLLPLKTWFKWLAKENYLLWNPASELELPKPSQRLPRSILSIEEVEAMLAQAEPDTPEGLRDRALLEVLYSSGLRRMEAASLAIYDVDVYRRVLFIREGKGAKDRVVPIGARALAWLERYLVESRPRLMTTDHQTLFVNDYGDPIIRGLVAAKVKRYMAFAGIKKAGATHLLRHAMATHMLEAGADMRALQVLLGHTNITTTQIYTHVSVEYLRAVHEATHPARLLRKKEAASLAAKKDEAI